RRPSGATTNDAARPIDVGSGMGANGVRPAPSRDQRTIVPASVTSTTAASPLSPPAIGAPGGASEPVASRAPDTESYVVKSPSTSAAARVAPTPATSPGPADIRVRTDPSTVETKVN